MTEPLLRVNVSAGYGKQTVLQGLAFDLERGERLGLVGGSGTGKSTLIMAIMGLLRWQHGWIEGEILLLGQNLLSTSEHEMREVRGKRVALIPQSPMSALNASLRLITHFEEAWRAHEAVNKDKLMSRLEELFEMVDLPTDMSFLMRKPSQISVGQAQRVVVALALLHRPVLLIADEPTSALDAENRSNVVNLLRDASLLDGTALLYVSHDLISVLQLCQRMAMLHSGKIVEALLTDGIEGNAKHASTLALLGSLPVPATVLYGYSHRPKQPVNSLSTDRRNQEIPQYVAVDTLG